MKSGARARMSEQLRRDLRANDCVDEFGDCVGIVEDPVDFGLQQDPEINAGW